jgi:hypothetical protein
MGRFVRVVEIIEGDVDDLRRRMSELPANVSASVVPTGAGVLVTLTTEYRAAPGSRIRALRSLHRMLEKLR